MLNKKNRLKKKKEFNFIYKKGESFHSKYLALFVTKTKLNFCKIGFSVNNKIGNSVIRHKVKRRLTEIIRLNLAKLPVNNYIFVAKIGIEKLNYKELSDNVFYILKKAKIIE